MVDIDGDGDAGFAFLVAGPETEFPFVMKNSIDRVRDAFEAVLFRKQRLDCVRMSQDDTGLLFVMERSQADAEFVLRRLGLDGGDLSKCLVEDFAKPLAPPLTPELEARIRDIFADDYDKLGYKPVFS